MGDGSGVVYTSDDVSALTQELQQIVNEQKVSEGYPSDYLYHRLSGQDGQPVITKIGDDHYAAWLKRDDGQVGAPFTDVVLLNAPQVQEIYGSRPPGSDSAYESTGRDVYVNSNLHADDPARRISADDASRVYYDVQSGAVIDTAEPGQFTGYASALLPNDAIKDGHVSSADLEQELKGYQLFPELVAEYTDNDRAKIAYERVVAEEVGASSAALYNIDTYGGNPTFSVDNIEIVYSIDFLDFEDGLKTRTFTPEAGPMIIPGQSQNDFAQIMRSEIDKGPEIRETANPLAGRETLLLSNSFRAISGYLAAGPSGEQAAEEAVNNAIKLFPEHRDVIAGYALAASDNPKIDPKSYLQEISQRSLGGQANDVSGILVEQGQSTHAISAIMEKWAQGAEDSLGNNGGGDVTRVSQDAVRHLAGVTDKTALEQSAAQVVTMLEKKGHDLQAQAIEAYAQNPSRDAERETMQRLAELEKLAPAMASQVTDALNNPQAGSQITFDEALASVQERLNALDTAGYFSEQKVDEMMEASGMDPASLNQEQKSDIAQDARDFIIQNVTADQISGMATDAADQALKEMSGQVERAIASRLSDVKQAVQDHYKPENLQRIYKDAVERKMAESGPAPTAEEMVAKFSAAEQNMVNQYVARLRPIAETNPAYLDALKEQANGKNPLMDEAVRILAEEIEGNSPAVVNSGSGPSGP